MLETISISCPKCGGTTEISVSRSKTREQTFAATSCRQCRAGFIAFTQEDGRILLLDGAAMRDATQQGQPQILAVIQPPAGKSGYRVEPPDYLGIFDRGSPPAAPPPGVSDEELRAKVVSSDRFLRRPDGSARPPAEAARSVGWRSVWVAQLNEALRTRLAGPPPLTFPPAIFISYRWGTHAENMWTAGLVRDLQARGYPVVFDRNEPGEPDVPRLVSRIADCRYFIAILDAGYLERIGRGETGERTKDGWVWDEYNTACSFSNAKQLRILGFLRAGTDLPNGFLEPVPGTPGNVLDVRTPGQLAHVLDDAFPPIGQRPDEASIDQARALLARSHEHVCAGRFESALADANSLTAILPGLIDGPAQRVRVALRAGWAAEGLAAAEEALGLAPQSRELLRAAGSFAAVAGQPRRAAQYLGAFLEAYAQEDRESAGSAHFALGSSLDDLDQVYPAIAHLEVARRVAPAAPGLLNTLGFVYRRAGETETAIARLKAGLDLDPSNVDLLVNLTAAAIEHGRPTDARAALDRLRAAAPERPEIAGFDQLIARMGNGALTGKGLRLLPVISAPKGSRWVTCSECDARVPLEPNGALCARCGSVTTLQPEPCPCCTARGRAIVAPGVQMSCPYCRRGRIAAEPGPSAEDRQGGPRAP
jgi:tetratricopeptide (TPR) repeat protein